MQGCAVVETLESCVVSTESISQVYSRRLCQNCLETQMGGEEIHMRWVMKSSYFEGYSVGKNA